MAADEPPSSPNPLHPPHPAVSASAVLKALSEVRRRGHWPLLQKLESAEPDLAEFVIEEITAVHHTLLKTGARPKAVRSLQRQIESLVLVCVLTLRRRAHQEEPPAPPPSPTNQED